MNSPRPLRSATVPTAGSVAAELARLAHEAGVAVDVADLERALAGMSVEELAAAPASYARDLADAKAMGLDLNDPSLDAIAFEGTADEAIRFLENDGNGRCASSG